MWLNGVEGIRNLLLANVTLNAAVGGRWYLDQVPPKIEVVYPYGIIADNASRARHEANEMKMADLRLLVKVVGVEQTATYQLGDLIRLTLDEATVTVDDPWYAYSCQLLTVVAFSEQVAQDVFTNAGGIYRLQMSA